MFLAPSRSDLGESLLITTLLGIPLGEPDGKIPTKWVLCERYSGLNFDKKMVSSVLTFIYSLYCKDRKQLKLFLTHIGPTVPLTPDPLVGVVEGGRGWRPIKIIC